MPSLLGVLRSVAVVHLVCFILGAPLVGVVASAAVYLVPATIVALRTGDGLADVTELVTLPQARRNAVVAIAGCAWAGALLTPLDWDVWYQRWPGLSLALATLCAVVVPL